MTSTIARVAGLAGAACLGIATLAVATPASADSGYTGKVVANGGLTARTAPSTHAGTNGAYAKGTKIKIACKVPGTAVAGNSWWYLIDGAKNRKWVSARYVENIGAAPKQCPEFDTELGDVRTTAALTARKGPNTADAKVGAYPKGTKVAVRCHVVGQKVGAKSNWYLTTKGAWLSARYLERVPSTPSNYPTCGD